MQSAPIQQPRSQLSSQISTMVPLVTTSTSKGKQARSPAVPQANDPKRRSKSAHGPTFELASQSTLRVPNTALFPVSVNSLEVRGRTIKGHPHTTDRNYAGRQHFSSNRNREGTTSRDLNYDKRSRDFFSRNNEEFHSDDEPEDNPTLYGDNLHLSSQHSVPQRQAAGAGRQIQPHYNLPKLPPISVNQHRWDRNYSTLAFYLRLFHEQFAGYRDVGALSFLRMCIPAHHLKDIVSSHPR